MLQEQGPAAEKRILVDEDYKAQVQAEKEQATERAETAQKARHAPLPEASFVMLVATLATQALVALGQIPNPLSQKPERDLDQAKHLIDTLGVLEQKTQGNLTPEEQRQLAAVLFDLRMQYVEALSKAQASRS
jgi:hypothetical protein